MAPADGAGLPELAGAREAEDFFEALGLAYDARVLEAHRLQVLQRFGAAVAAVAAGAAEEERREALRRALREAHDVFAGGARPPGQFTPTGAARLVQLRRPD